VLYDVSHLCACQGGPTITQQLVKDVYLGGSDSGLSFQCAGVVTDAT
jgi:membrane peptidoglycan carboxypeptidase